MNPFLGAILKALAPLLDARFLTLAAPSFTYLYTQPAIANTIIYSIAIMVAMAAVSHLIRKVFFPYVDLEMYAKTAMETAQGAAIVFFSVTLMLCTVLWCTVTWLKG